MSTLWQNKHRCLVLIYLLKKHKKGKRKKSKHSFAKRNGWPLEVDDAAKMAVQHRTTDYWRHFQIEQINGNWSKRRWVCACESRKRSHLSCNCQSVDETLAVLVEMLFSAGSRTGAPLDSAPSTNCTGQGRLFILFFLVFSLVCVKS